MGLATKAPPKDWVYAVLVKDEQTVCIPHQQISLARAKELIEQYRQDDQILAAWILDMEYLCRLDVQRRL